MRPTLRFLSDDLVQRIVAEAIDILCTLGVEIDHRQTLSALSDHGAKIDVRRHRAILTIEILDRAIRSAPASFRLYDVNGNETHDFSDQAVYFTPGSSALHVLDHRTKRARPPSTKDYVEHTKVVSRLAPWPRPRYGYSYPYRPGHLGREVYQP